MFMPLAYSSEGCLYGYLLLPASLPLQMYTYYHMRCSTEHHFVLIENLDPQGHCGIACMAAGLTM